MTMTEDEDEDEDQEEKEEEAREWRRELSLTKGEKQGRWRRQMRGWMEEGTKRIREED